jgi:caspase domain-containing protein
MPRTVYALLVAIDTYPASLPQLRGCVNDIDRIEAWLRNQVTSDGSRLEILALRNEQATREAVIDGFRQHLTQATGDDVALFYYAGHGSQSPSPREFWDFEPDRLDETLVCWNSRLPGIWDLADKELAYLISEVGKRDPHIAVVLDCCHSGSGTRAPGEEGVTVRRLQTDQRERPIETFLIGSVQVKALVDGDAPASASGWFVLPHYRHIVLSACAAEEEAKELVQSGLSRGAFSYYLLEVLERSGGALTYRDVFKRASALLRGRVSAQSPQIEASRSSDLNQPFLGGAIRSMPRYFTVTRDREHGWVMDAGSVHGIPEPAGAETTSLALFSYDTPGDRLDRLSDTVGVARVQRVLAAQSAVAVALADGSQPDPTDTYKAVLTAVPLPAMRVAFSGEERAVEIIRHALAEAGPQGQPSLLVREGAPADAELIVSAENSLYRIRRRADAYALVVDTPGFTSDGAQLAVERLEHIARWRTIVEVGNPSRRLPPDAVRVEILRQDADGEWRPIADGPSVRLEYERKGGRWHEPLFKIRLTNTSRHRLYCVLLDLPESYGVFPNLLPGGGEWLEPARPGEPVAQILANRGEPVRASIPDDLWRLGVVEFRDTLKLIAATDQCDATLFQQDDLPLAIARGERGLDRGAVIHGNTLSRLMRRVQTRHISTGPATTDSLSDWTTVEIAFTTVRPQEASAIPAPGQRTTLGHGVVIHGHSALRASARLTTLPEASRDAGNLTVPAVLRDHPEAAQPFEFTGGTRGEPGPSVLELVDVSDHAAVSAQNPLMVSIASPLGTNEHLLPYAFDGEFFLPLGRASRSAEGVDITLERLPEPTAGGARSASGSIRILLYKLVGTRLGLPYAYPLLAAATVGSDGTVEYVRDPEQVQALVMAARRIVLYIHGIIGDTRAMAASARTGWLAFPAAIDSLADRYDLILTFDYENLHTSIEENARSLKVRLQAAGLGPNHGKRLHIVAHSMGGLVSRWFIEREGGNQVVQHLFMLGTPNGGSPWPTVQDWATSMLAVALNAASTVAWPIGLLGGLASTLEYVDVSLDEMKRGSELLRSLASTADPGIAYTIIAGNTSIRASLLATDPTHPSPPFERLWARLKPRQWLHSAADLAFFQEPNDIAASVESIADVPSGRVRAALVREIGCDHVTYFTSDTALQLLAEVSARAAADVTAEPT